MSTSISSRMLLPARDTRMLLTKWIVALVVPLTVFTLWSGESIINAVIAPGSVGLNVPTDPVSRVQAAIFVTVFYGAVIVLAGYLVAADSGRRSIIELWTDIFIFTVLPLSLLILFGS